MPHAPTAEDKIASIKQQFDNLEIATETGSVISGESSKQPVVSSSTSSPARDSEGFVVAPDFKKGKIVAIKQQLSAKLEISTAADGEAVGDNDGLVMNQQGRTPPRHGEGVVVAHEVEDGKVSAMKDMLVSEGLGIDGASATGVSGEGGSDNHSNGSFVAPEVEQGKVEDMKCQLTDRGLDLHPAITAAASAPATATKEHTSSDTPSDRAAYSHVSETETGSSAIAPFSGDSVDSADPTSTPGGDVALEGSQRVTFVPATIAGESPAPAPPGEPCAVQTTSVSENEGKPAVAGASVADSNDGHPSAADPKPKREPSPAKAATRGKSPLSTRTRRMQANGESARPRSAGRRTPSPVVTRKAGTPQRGRQSTTARTTTTRTSHSGSATSHVGSPAARARRQSTETGVAATSGSRTRVTPRGRSSHVAGNQGASPHVGSVSRAVVTTPETTEPRTTSAMAVASGTGSSAPRRRSTTPVQRRRTPPVQQQTTTPVRQTSTTPVRPVVMSGSSPAPMGTPSTAELAGRRLHDQARETRERLERRRREGASPAVSADGLSPFTPRRWSNPIRGNPSVAGMERVERLYRDATERDIKLEMARREEEENPRDCTFTPKITARASSRGRSEKRRQQEAGMTGDEAKGSGSMSRFHALYLDAKRRRAKMEALTDARIVEVAGPGTPEITDLGRKQSTEPLDARLKENAERWARRWKELEEKKVEQDVEGCTFQPTFSVGRIGRSASAPRLRGRDRERNSSSGGDADWNGAPFVVRAQKYQAAREERLMELKRELEKKELAEATFQPKVSASFAMEANSSSPEHGEICSQGNRKSGGNPAGRDPGVFERLLRAAIEQEQHKAALKADFLQKERESFHDFQPRLRNRRSDSPARPLDARLKESTEHWVQSREAREQQRIEKESEQCTFHPAVGSVSGSKASGRARRSSSADSRSRVSAAERGSRSAASAAGAGTVGATKSSRMSLGEFEARSKAFQDAKEQRLMKLREEKSRNELQEATFRPVIGFGANLGAGGGKQDVTATAVGKPAPPATASQAASGVGPVVEIGAMKSGRMGEADDGAAVEKTAATLYDEMMSVAQKKVSASEAKGEAVSFKRRISAGAKERSPAGAERHNGSASGNGTKRAVDVSKTTTAVVKTTRVTKTMVVMRTESDAASGAAAEIEAEGGFGCPTVGPGGAVEGDVAGVNVKDLSARLQQLAEGSPVSTSGADDEVEEGQEQVQYQDQQKTPPDAKEGAKEELETHEPGQTKCESQMMERDQSSEVVNDTPVTPPVSVATAVHSDGGSAGDFSGPKPQVENCASPMSPAPLPAAPDVGRGNGRNAAAVEVVKKENGSEKVAAKFSEGQAEHENTFQKTASPEKSEVDEAARSSLGAEDSEADSGSESPSADAKNRRVEGDSEGEEDEDEEEEEGAVETQEREDAGEHHVGDDDDNHAVDDDDNEYGGDDYDDDYYAHEEDESDGDDYDYTGAARTGDQGTRSLADFDQVQREIEAKLRAL